MKLIITSIFLHTLVGEFDEENTFYVQHMKGGISRSLDQYYSLVMCLVLSCL